MNGLKYTTTITVETLSPQSVPSLLNQLSLLLHAETDSGTINKADGDTVTWKTETEDYEL